MKYVILSKSGQFDRICCGFNQTHKQLAAGAVAEGFTATSAGFVDFQDGFVRTSGYSESLDLAPDSMDSALIQAMRNAMAKQKDAA